MKVHTFGNYELGRHLARFDVFRTFAVAESPFEILVGVEPGYRREQDVRIQTELVLGKNFTVFSDLDYMIAEVRELVLDYSD